jgi:hypothetical protein
VIGSPSLPSFTDSSAEPIAASLTTASGVLALPAPRWWSSCPPHATQIKMKTASTDARCMLAENNKARVAAGLFVTLP